MQPLTVVAERLWQSLLDLARIGATPKGGVRRISLIAVQPSDAAVRR